MCHQIGPAALNPIIHVCAATDVQTSQAIESSHVPILNGCGCIDELGRAAEVGCEDFVAASHKLRHEGAAEHAARASDQDTHRLGPPL
jgi:hypothetical protein